MLKSVSRWLVRGLAVLGAVLLIVSFTPAVVWYAGILAGPWTEPRGRILIVPGADAIADGIIGESSYWRAVYAVRAWREGGFEEMVLSGAPPIVEPMKRFLVSEGVPEASIRLESRSHSTRENALFTRELLGADPSRKAVLLTSDYHMYRAWRAFRKAGVETMPRPFPDARKRGQSWRRRWPVFLELVLETGKVVYYRARGWI